MAKAEEKCEDCEVAILGGMVINVCEYAKPKGVDCHKLKDDFLRGKTTVKDMVDTLRPKVQHDKDAVMELDEILKLAMEDE